MLSKHKFKVIFWLLCAGVAKLVKLAWEGNEPYRWGIKASSICRVQLKEVKLWL